MCKGTKTELRSINDTLKNLIRSNDDRLSTVESKLTNLENIKDSVRSELDEGISKVRTDIAGDISRMGEEISE